MLSSNNILLPSNGRPVAAPTQDMVIGSYYLTNPGLHITDLERIYNDTKVAQEPPREEATRSSTRSTRTRRASRRTARSRWRSRRSGRLPQPGLVLGVEGLRRARRQGGRVGAHDRGSRALQLDHPRRARLPEQDVRQAELGDLAFECFNGDRPRPDDRVPRRLKDFGFRYATMGGISVGIEDLEVPHEKARSSRTPTSRWRASRRRTPAASSRTGSATTRSSTPGRTRTTTSRTPWCGTWSARTTASTRST